MVLRLPRPERRANPGRGRGRSRDAAAADDLWASGKSASSPQSLQKANSHGCGCSSASADIHPQDRPASEGGGNREDSQHTDQQPHDNQQLSGEASEGILKTAAQL